jgi:prevent-host-death family protein
MDAVTLSNAKANLSALVERASAGEEVTIMCHGKPKARLVPVETPRKKIDWDAIKLVTDQMKFQSEPAVDLIRRMRDDGY